MVRPESARAVARVIVAGERDNCKSHAIYRIEGCLRLLAAGKVEAEAVPAIHDAGTSVIEVDAGGGFSNPAFYVAMDVLAERARGVMSQTLAASERRHCSRSLMVPAVSLDVAPSSTCYPRNRPQPRCRDGKRRPPESCRDTHPRHIFRRSCFRRRSSVSDRPFAMKSPISSPRSARNSASSSPLGNRKSFRDRLSSGLTST